MSTHDIQRHPIHLGLAASAEVEPAFTGDPAWYEGYAARHAGDGREGRLVSQHRFDSSWTMWEMHPQGDELVLVLAGEVEFLFDRAGELQAQRVADGGLVVVPRGVWHTARVRRPARLLHVTMGAGTQHRAVAG